MPVLLYFTDSEEAFEPIAKDRMALLIGFSLTSTGPYGNERYWTGRVGESSLAPPLTSASSSW